MDVLECDLVDVRALGRFNDNFKYILSVIDVFSKFLHLVPLRSKTGTAVASAFTSILKDSSRRRRPVWVRTDKGNEFLNRHFREMLKREGIQFQVCRNPDVKCSMVERAHTTIRDRLYKYFTYKNTYRYIDVLPKFVKTYNDTVHSATDMAPSRVTDSDVLAIWKRMEARRRVSRGATRPYQQRKDEVCQERRAEFQHGDYSDRECDREASATPLRLGRFKRDSHRGAILSGRTDPGSRHETYSL